MDSKTKYRVIGIVVLVLALAVIIVPLFFGHGEKGPKITAQIPNQPSKPQMQLAIPSASQDTTTAANNTQTAAANTPADTDVTTTTTTAQNAVTDNAPDITAVNPNTQVAANTTNAVQQPATNNNSTQSSTVSQPVENTPSVKSQKPSHEPRSKTGKIKTKYAYKHEHHKAEHTHKVAKLKQAELAQAWTVQLASFTQKGNAENLIKRLRAKGFPAYIHQAKNGEELLVRVYVGPELRRDKAEELVKRLHTEFGMRGLVVKYQV